MPRKAKTTTANVQARFAHGITTSDLPLTLRDAIEFTRALGIRYIWIDAVCILQDSESDWQSESSKMCQVYSGAYCTLAASASRDTEAGLPKYNFVDKLGAGSALFSFPAGAPDGEAERICLSANEDVKDHGTVLFQSQEPLQTRGWALQERHLSPRVVYFCKDRLVWECLAGTSSSYYPWCPWSPLKTETRRIFDSGQSIQNFFDGGGWEKLIQEYSRRSLTHNKDKIYAIESLVAALDRPGNDQYVAGHWRSALPSSLCWRRDTASRGEPSGRNLKRAPSWSWVSMDGAITFFHVPPPTVHATLLAARSETFRDPIIGVRYEGWIRVRGRLKHFGLRTDPPSPALLGIQPDGWLIDDGVPQLDKVGDALLDEPSIFLANQAEVQNVFCLAISHDWSPPSSFNGKMGTAVALILVPTQKEGHFRRVGISVGMDMKSFETMAPSTLMIV